LELKISLELEDSKRRIIDRRLWLRSIAITPGREHDVADRRSALRQIAAAIRGVNSTAMTAST
jgi:hypothetical protein